MLERSADGALEIAVLLNIQALSALLGGDALSGNSLGFRKDPSVQRYVTSHHLRLCMFGLVGATNTDRTWFSREQLSLTEPVLV